MITSRKALPASTFITAISVIVYLYAQQCIEWGILAQPSLF